MKLVDLVDLGLALEAPRIGASIEISLRRMTLPSGKEAPRIGASIEIRTVPVTLPMLSGSPSHRG